MINLGVGTKLAPVTSFFLMLALGFMAYLANALADEIEVKVSAFRNELVAEAEQISPEILADPHLA